LFGRGWDGSQLNRRREGCPLNKASARRSLAPPEKRIRPGWRRGETNNGEAIFKEQRDGTFSLCRKYGEPRDDPTIFRWIHLVLSIPILGYIYSPFEKLPSYAFKTRYVFVPIMVLSGLWMWKGHVVRRLFSKSAR